MPVKPIAEVLKQHTQALMSITGVTGIGQGLCENETCVIVYVTRKTPALSRQLPARLEGHRVKIEETGAISAFPKDPV